MLQLRKNGGTGHFITFLLTIPGRRLTRDCGAKIISLMTCDGITFQGWGRSHLVHESHNDTPTYLAWWEKVPLFLFNYLPTNHSLSTYCSGFFGRAAILSNVGSNQVQGLRFNLFWWFKSFKVQFWWINLRFGRFEVQFQGSANLSKPLWA